VECASCKAGIDEDSWFCDQCGVELFKCPQCGRLGKGKRCTFDGKPLVSLKTAANGDARPDLAAAAASTATPLPTSASTPASTPAPATTSASATPAPTRPGRLRLFNSAQGVILYPSNGDILGRRNGPHAGELARFDQISSNHLKLQQWPDGHWSAADLNSTNHSFYDGRQLEAFKDQALAPGSTLMLGDVPFQVSFE
jgi:FHA domain